MKNFILLFISVILTLPLFAQVERKVVVEHFTNSRCGICASRNPAFYQTLEDYPQVMHIAYHPSAPYASCLFNQHNPEENDERTIFYDVYGSTPRAVLQGESIPAQNPLIQAGQIEAKLGGQADYTLSVTKMPLSGNTHKVDFTIERVSGSPGPKTLLVYAGLAEATVNYAAPNGEDVHYDVFRKRIYYDTLVLNNVGSVRTISVDYDHNAEWMAEEIYAYVLLHEPSTKVVLQAASSQESPSFIGSRNVTEVETLFYPNPASTVVYIQPQYAGRFQRLELFSIVGNRLAELEVSNRIDLTGLPEGIYFVVATDKQRRRFTSRLVVQH